MKNILLAILLFSFFTNSSNAQEVIKLWDSYSPPTSYNEVDNAELTVFLPKTKTLSTKTPIVLIFPGGGYGGVSMQNEGIVLAKWLQSEGFAAAVLKYRLPYGHKEVPFDDAQEAVRIITDNAEKWNVDLEKFGIAGSSAGGHLAAVFTNRLVDSLDALHPAYNILFYPVISFEEPTKGGTRNNLIGLDPSAEDIRNYSAQYLVTSRTPNTILLLGDNDESVPSTHSTEYYDALKHNDVKGSLYIFPTGGHGWAMSEGFEYNKIALSLLSKWLQQFK